MAQASGIETKILVCEETTYGQAPGSPSCDLVYVTKYTPAGQRALLNDTTLRPGQRTALRPDLGKIDLRGTLSQNFAAEDSGLLLKHMMGSISTSGTGPYTHTLTTGSLPVGLTFEKDHGASISGTGRYMRHSGCRVNSGAFSFGEDGYVTADYEIIGASETPSLSSLDSTPNDPGHTSFTVWNGAFEEGGSAAATLLSMSLQYSNSLDAETYPLNLQGARGALKEGQAVITGSAVFLFDSMTILNKAIAGTETSLTATLQRGSGAGSAGNEYVQFDLQQMIYERTAPPIEGPQGLRLSVNFTGYGDGLRIILKNAEAL
jgi:hypothetical protein